MKKQKLLITGGSSFLGGYLAKAALPRFAVHATFCRNVVSSPHINWIRLDLTQVGQIDTLISQLRPDVVIHNAALTNVDYCENNQAEAEQVNILATRRLAEACHRIGASLIYISTDLVFDGTHPPYSEESPTCPVSFYGWTKAEAEKECMKHAPNSLVVRPSIIFGPPALKGTSFTEWMIAHWKNGRSTPLFTDQYRTPIFGANLAEAIVETAEKGLTGILHIGGKERISRYDFGLLLADHLQFPTDLLVPVKMADVPLPGKRPADVSLNIGKAASLLSTPLLGPREAIKRAYPNKRHPDK